MPTEPFHLGGPRGGRFCLARAPRDEAQLNSGVLFVPPFAEEMNKSRRVVAEQSRALAESGFLVLQLDLYGTGDSAGDFGDATWDGWLEDVHDGVAWLRSRLDGPVWLWGLRTGCLLATAAASRVSEPAHLVLWQPILSGAQFFRQFLRMKLASEWLAGGNREGGTDALRRQILDGESVEVAGYLLAPDLARGLEVATLSAPASTSTVVWLEVVAEKDATLFPTSQIRIEAWREAGCKIIAESVEGQPFWSTVEIAECPTLVERTVALLLGSAT